MKPSNLLDALREGARGLNKDGAFVGWFNRRGVDGDEYIALGDLRAAALYKGRKTRTYKILKPKQPFELEREFPVYLICCPAIFHEGRIYIGGDNWYQSFRGPKIVFHKTQVIGSRPSGEFRDVFSTKPGSEVTLATSLKAERAIFDRQLCRWGLAMLDADVNEQDGFNPFGDDEILPPVFLVPRKRECLKLREGKNLREMVVSALRRDEWHVDGLLGLSAPDRGVACCVSEQGKQVIRFSHDNGCEDKFVVQDVEEVVENHIFHVFGVRQRVDLRVLFPEGKKVPMRSMQTFFSPAVKELTEDMLQKHWEWEDRRNSAQYAGNPFTEEPPVLESTVQALKYLAALTTSQNINGVIALDINVVIGRVAPFVHMKSLMCKIQRLVNVEEHMIYESDGVTIDLPHVCARMALQRRSQEFRSRVEKLQRTSGVESAEEVFHASSSQG